MKVLIATSETQGQRSNDFNHCDTGELVMFGSPCDTDHGDPDGTCGCARSMIGLDTRKSTTTAKVIDMVTTHGQLMVAYARSQLRVGYPTSLEESMRMINRIIGAIEQFNVGDVLEVRENQELRFRSHGPASR